MRIITRPDFDGVVCAALLQEVQGENIPVVWVQPSEIQGNQFKSLSGDIIANLPFSLPCALWFDHHISNTTDQPYQGLFRIAPSAAGLVNEYYHAKLGDRFQELVLQADKIDSAQLTLNEILNPQEYPYILLSMTVFNRKPSDLDYCNHLVTLLRTESIDKIVKNNEVARRTKQVLEANRDYEKYLKQYTYMKANVCITDFRGMDPIPDGNRFLVYSLFPEAVVNIKIYNENDFLIIKLGHSIINRKCNVNVGKLLAKYGGGGHKGAGACLVKLKNAGRSISEIIDVLIKNKPEVN
ncbi:MAG: exopolyphosphatase [Desulfobacteraceae bacterium]|nr:exopolyphosphatase [Desulfobacteraceae bacterium]